MVRRSGAGGQAAAPQRTDRRARGKKARCARSFAVPAPGTDVTGCTTCHGGAVNTHHGNPVSPVASGMSCPTCHTDKLPLTPATHAPLATTCSTCHP